MHKVRITETEAAGETLGAVAFRCVFLNEIGVILSEGYITPTLGEPVMFLVPASIFNQLTPPPGDVGGAPQGAATVAPAGADQITSAAA